MATRRGNHLNAFSSSHAGANSSQFLSAFLFVLATKPNYHAP
jgi:hypothetical protein